MKKTEIIITETNAKRIGLVNQVILSKIGGRRKSFALGGTKPSLSPLSSRSVRTSTSFWWITD
jgi:sporulation protein YlmC with PRC-barrel domain